MHVDPSTIHKGIALIKLVAVADDVEAPLPLAEPLLLLWDL